MASRPASSGSTELFKEPQAVVLVTGENSPDALSTPGPPSSIEAHKDGDLPADSPAAAQTRRATTTALSMAALGVVALLSSLDITIVTTALPSIVADFKSKLGYVWIGSAFTLAFTAITPVWGSVADVWGRKPIMLIALVLFLAGSLLCALAPTMDLMIAGRALQGIGASGTGTMTNVIISDLFALRDRGLYLAIMSIVSAVGTAIGPVIGGTLTTKLTWRWCFWINLPIGAVALVALVVFLKVPNPHTSVLAGLKAIDWVGSFLIVGGALMILLGLDFGDVTYPWSSPTVIALVVFGAAVIGLFIYNEWKLARNPILPLRLFQTASTSAAFGVFACVFYVFIGLLYYLPLYAQSVLGADVLTSGLCLLPLIVSCCLSAAFGGVLVQQTGKYLPFMYAAQVLLTLGVGLFINIEFEKNMTKLIIYEIIVGVGVGLSTETPVIAALAGTSERDNAATIAAMGFLRSMATAVSVVVGGVIFQNEMSAAGPRLTAQLGETLAGEFSGGLAMANVELIGALPADQQTVVRQAYFDSLRKVWIMYVAFAALAIILNLFVRAHHLSKENEEVVLGTDRHEASAQQTDRGGDPEATKLRLRPSPHRS